MIDLHSHVLPGIDDGAADFDASVKLAQAAAENGITRLAATPHLRHDFPGVVPAELARRTTMLRDALHGVGVSLDLVSGAEVDLVWADEADESDLRRATYSGLGKWLLVETPYEPLTHAFEHIIHRLQTQEFQLLLAHPERSPTFQRDPARLYELVRRGVLLQVTAASLATRRRRSFSRRLACSLVREGLAHVIASDWHGASGRPGLLAGVDAASREDARRARWMVTDAPAAILAGEVPAAPSFTDLRTGTRRRTLRRVAR